MASTSFAPGQHGGPRRAHTRDMSVEFGFPPALSFLTRRAGRARSVVQIYRCPKGHLTEIEWTADEVRLAANDHQLLFHCALCDEARVASSAEAGSILAALGFPPQR